MSHLTPVWDHLKLLYVQRLTASSSLFFFFPESPDSYLFLLMQVARRNQACETDFTETLAKYLLSFAAAMPQSDIHQAMPTSPSTASEFGLAMPASTVQPPPIPLHQAAASMSLWTCFLAADASVVVKQVKITLS